MKLRCGSFFSGIGGPELAAEWMGWENVFHCEWNPFGQRILKYYWPNSDSYHDIKETDFTRYRNQIDVLTGGFPCQPYSNAGKRLGTEDDRHLWPEMLRGIKEIQPRWVVGENVDGLVTWNRGLVFHDVKTDLEAAGYEVQSVILPACGIGAPHRRYRTFIVAYRGSLRQHTRGTEQSLRGDRADGKAGASSNANGTGQGNSERRTDQSQAGKIRWNEKSNVFITHGGESGIVAHANDPGTFFRMRSEREGAQTDQGREGQPQPEPGKDGGNANASHTQSSGSEGQPISQSWQKELDGPRGGTFRTWWEHFPTQSPICGGNDGLPRELDGITFPNWRTESVKAYGNAIVPQLMYQIFRAIEEYELLIRQAA